MSVRKENIFFENITKIAHNKQFWKVIKPFFCNNYKKNQHDKRNNMKDDKKFQIIKL